MRVLQVHNTYQQHGGEDAVVRAEYELLRRFGHEVEQYIVSNDAIGGWRDALRAGLTAHYSPASREIVKAVIRRFRPDVVHVHNFFPLVTPSVYDACHETNVAVVQTLHNFRLVCPGAQLTRNGTICELCVHASPYRYIHHRCYRGSLSGTLVSAHMVATHRRRNTWSTRVDRFIALTEFARDKYMEAGFPGERIAVKPNFLEASMAEGSLSRERRGALFVGRMSEEKGVGTLFKAFGSIDIPLRVAGDGPMMDWAKASASENITLLGALDAAAVAREMARAAFLVFPSEWYEGFPMTLVEAYAAGLPVIASRLGSMNEIIRDGKTGLLFEPCNADDLAARALALNASPKLREKMGAAGRSLFLSRYTGKVNHETLRRIYEEAIASRMLP